MTELNVDRLRKMMETAGHPTTPDPEAVNAVRLFRKMLDNAGMSFADLSLGDTGWDRPSWSDRTIKHKLIRLEDLEQLYAESKVHIRELLDRHQKLEDENKALQKQVKEKAAAITKQDKIIAKQATRVERMEIKIGAQVKEIKALRAERSELRREKTVRRPTEDASPATQAAKAALSSAADIDGVIAVLRVLYEIDPGMRIKTGLAFAIIAANDGIPINQLAEQVGETTPASMRYTMRALGQGWPGGRAGHGLVMECANSNGERARLHVVTPKGRAVCDALRAAFNGSGVKPRPEIKMAA